MYDLENIEKNIIQDSVYNGLNLCRTLQYLKEEKILSKLEGGKWGLKNLPNNFQKIVQELIDIYWNSIANNNLNNEELKEFAKYMIEKINAEINKMSEIWVFNRHQIK